MQRRMEAALLDETCDVYAPADGYTAPVKTGLRCHLQTLLGTQLASVEPPAPREERLERRILFFARAYAMPRGARVLHRGSTWNVVAASDAEARVADTTVYRTVELIKTDED
jgi:hypothetical protein